MKPSKHFAFLVLAFASQTLRAGADLNNEAITRMAAAGLGDGVIIGMIDSQPGTYTLGAEDIIQLKTNKVPDRVIEAMVRHGRSPLTALAGTQPVTEIGVYFKQGPDWKDVKPEVVNWKSGGVVKHVGSLGVVKGDMNGLVNGADSPTRVQNPLSLLIYTLEGVGASEYQLVHLHEHRNCREFRTVTGGVFHVSEGAMRDIVPYESKKVAPRTYLVTLEGLQPGEYGFLPPDNEIANHASASLGKMYTFRINE